MSLSLAMHVERLLDSSYQTCCLPTLSLRAVPTGSSALFVAPDRYAESPIAIRLSRWRDTAIDDPAPYHYIEDNSLAEAAVGGWRQSVFSLPYLA